ncbi:unnamed protein product [Clonostachys chloroleuca]|uniref:DUF2293 domain-containing protein n=1 Tax=Clonostachys chloroleuca TaxID=1926264 RepID=A0AA35LS21_9HYPO|nr:unnamed protein product [Clonostachys chloroleuca]
MVESEPKVPSSAAMPKGYGFLPKGDPYRTGLCRRLTQAAGKQVYVVVDKRRTAVGIRAPKYIINEVHEKDRATREDRRAAVQKRDVATRSDFEVAILRLFPRIPPQDLEKVLDRALKKRSGRVGRTGRLAIDSKARLAVMAHIRHNHTEYDSLLKQKGKSRGSARDDIALKLKQLCGEWREGAKLDAAHINEASVSAARGSPGRTNQKNTRISRRARRVAATIIDGKHSERQHTTDAKTCTHDNNGQTTSRDPPRGQKKKWNGKKVTMPSKPVTGTKTRQETRQTRNTRNLDKAKLLGPDALIMISSDESDPDDPEADTDPGGESDNSFIVGDHSDHFMDEDWEIDLDSDSDSDEEMDDIEE